MATGKISQQLYAALDEIKKVSDDADATYLIEDSTIAAIDTLGDSLYECYALATKLRQQLQMTGNELLGFSDLLKDDENYNDIIYVAQVFEAETGMDANSLYDSYKKLLKISSDLNPIFEVESKING